MDNTVVFYLTCSPFPGAIRFLNELRGNMDDFGTHQLAPKIIVLSARPSWQKPTQQSLKMFDIDGVNIYGDTLYGKPIRDVLIKDCLHAHQEEAEVAICRAMASRKMKNLKSWVKDHKGKRWPIVFVGDSGEGDVIAAKSLLSEDIIQYAFIRTLQDDDPMPFNGKLAQRSLPGCSEHERMFHFTDFQDAAAIARKHGLISEKAYARVVEAFETEKALDLSQSTQQVLRQVCKEKLHGVNLPAQRWINRFDWDGAAQEAKQRLRKHMGDPHCVSNGEMERCEAQHCFDKSSSDSSSKAVMRGKLPSR
eukprot:EG_transcript_12024